MDYTEEQKDLLLDRLFNGVVCLDIYRDIDIRHRNYGLSYYNLKYNEFTLSRRQIWDFFTIHYDYKYQEIKDLTQGILRDTTKRKELTTSQLRRYPRR